MIIIVPVAERPLRPHDRPSVWRSEHPGGGAEADQGVARASAAAPASAAHLPRSPDRALVVAVRCPSPSALRTSSSLQVLIYAIALFGLNLLTGHNGQISIGHSVLRDGRLHPPS
jgi:hypothetical protein